MLCRGRFGVTPTWSRWLVACVAVLSLGNLPQMTMATKFQFVNMTCTGNLDPGDDFYATCEAADGTLGACDGGDQLKVEGSISVNASLPTAYNVTWKICLFSLPSLGSVICVYSDTLPGELCDLASLTDSTGGEATCGDEGDFDVSVDETLPPFDLSFGHGYKLHVEATLEDLSKDENSADREFAKCDVTIMTTSSSDDTSQTTASMVLTWSAVFGAAVVALAWRRRRVVAVREASSSSSSPSGSAPTTAFVEMTDQEAREMSGRGTGVV